MKWFFTACVVGVITRLVLVGFMVVFSIDLETIYEVIATIAIGLFIYEVTERLS